MGPNLFQHSCQSWLIMKTYTCESFDVLEVDMTSVNVQVLIQ